jgi:hypothetical protein
MEGHVGMSSSSQSREYLFKWTGGRLIDDLTHKRTATSDAGVTLGDLAEHMRIGLNEAEYRVSRFASDIHFEDWHLRESNDGDGRMVYDVKVTKDWPFPRFK